MASLISQGPPTRRGRFRTDALISVFGTAGGQFVNLAIVPLLSRLYSPHEFGIWALYMAVLIVFSTIVTLRFDIAIVTARTKRVAGDVMLLSVILAVTGGLLIWGVVALVGFAANGNPWLDAQVRWFFWEPLGFSSAAIFALGISWWMRARQYHRITAARIGSPLLSGAFQVGLAWLLLGRSHDLGLIAGSALGQAACAIAICAAILPWSHKLSNFRAVFLRSVAATKRFRNLAIYTMPYTLQTQMVRQIAVVILGSLASVQTAGLYSIAQRFVYNPMVLVAAALEQAVYPRLAAAPNDPAIHNLIAGIMVRIAAPIGVACAIGTVFAKPLLIFALGPQWGAGAPYLVATCYATGSMVATSWFVRIFDILGRQRLHLILDVAGNSIIIAMFAGMLVLTHDAVWAVAVFCAVTAIYFAVWAVVAFHISHMNQRVLIRTFAIAAGSWAGAMILCMALSYVTGIGLAVQL